MVHLVETEWGSFLGNDSDVSFLPRLSVDCFCIPPSHPVTASFSKIGLLNALCKTRCKNCVNIYDETNQVP